MTVTSAVKGVYRAWDTQYKDLQGRVACYPTAWQTEPRYQAVRTTGVFEQEQRMYKPGQGTFNMAAAKPGDRLTFAYPAEKCVWYICPDTT